jgi:hypothetical protein
VGTALLAALVWVICDAAGLNVWISTGVAFLVAYTVRVLAMYRGWEEPMPKEPPGVYAHEHERPLLGPKLRASPSRSFETSGSSPRSQEEDEA